VDARIRTEGNRPLSAFREDSVELNPFQCRPGTSSGPFPAEEK